MPSNTPGCLAKLALQNRPTALWVAIDPLYWRRTNDQTSSTYKKAVCFRGCGGSGSRSYAQRRFGESWSGCRRSCARQYPEASEPGKDPLEGRALPLAASPLAQRPISGCFGGGPALPALAPLRTSSSHLSLERRTFFFGPTLGRVGEARLRIARSFCWRPLLVGLRFDVLERRRSRAEGKG